MEKKESDIDWSILKGSIILTCFCILISIGLVSGSYYFNTNMKNEYIRNKSAFQSISSKYLDVDQEEKLLREYYPQFVKLYYQGIIGREKRLNWIEVLRQAGEAIKLPSLKYTISTQEQYIPEYSVIYSGYSLYHSSMELNLGLLHEGDLFKLLDYINKNVEGAYTVSECTFTPKGNNIIFQRNEANVSAKCILNWITIDLAGGQGIEI